MIASRASRLARVQAAQVGAALTRASPRVEVTYRWIRSEGDKRSTEALADAGGKGLFAGAIERAVLGGEADLAVHSLKDLPSKQTPGLVLASVLRRADPRDALVPPHDGGLEGLPRGARVATGSPRRAAQLRHRRPDLAVGPIRGNVETRIRKVLEEGEAAATFLAVAGLARLELTDTPHEPLEPSEMLPGAGQGAIVVQCRRGDHRTLKHCLPVNHPRSAEAVHLERRLVAGLEGDCHASIGAHAEPVGDGAYRLRGRVLDPAGGQCLEDERVIPSSAPGRAVDDLVVRFRERGADELLRGS